MKKLKIPTPRTLHVQEQPLKGDLSYRSADRHVHEKKHNQNCKYGIQGFCAVCGEGVCATCGRRCMFYDCLCVFCYNHRSVMEKWECDHKIRTDPKVENAEYCVFCSKPVAENPEILPNQDESSKKSRIVRCKV